MRERIKRPLCSAVILMMGILLFGGPAQGKPEFSASTGLACGACHVDPVKGGALNARGEEYRAAGYRLPDAAGSAATGIQLLKFLLGSIHVLFSFVWFGAILYIHLFITPKRFTSGLPTPEIRLGWIGILVVGVTGVALSLLRIQRLSELWTTTFGIVWIIKVGAFAVMVLIAAVVTTKVNRRMREEAGERQARTARIIFEGEVFDVSGSRMWKEGIHMGRHHAGEDLTSAMAGAPHGAEVMERVKKVGPAGQDELERPSGAMKVFVPMAYINLGLVIVILLCVAYWNWGPSIIVPPAGVPEGEKLIRSLVDGSEKCIRCHREKGFFSAQIEEWSQGRHALAAVGCYGCHRAEPGEPDAVDHNGFTVATIVSPMDCARCHPEAAREFASSRHAEGGQILASLDNYLGEVVEGIPAGISGCQQCHGSTIRVASDGKVAPETWPNTGIGRINPDKSKGSCSACHPRHRFAAAAARRPESCGRCHMGPDHPQFEIYQESKHGVAFAEAQDRMNLRSAKWRLGKDYTAAPTCVTCHNGADPRREFTHDVGLRIAWTLRPEISVRQPDWESRRDQMKETCLNCHSPGWTGSFFIQFDNAVNLYNEKFAGPGAAVMKKLAEEGKLTPVPFDEKIEWTWFLLWHHEGRRARHGAAMMGPDYTQWHGFFEVAERFYLHFLPEAEELLPGVTDPVLEDRNHQWLKGMPDDLRKELEGFYRDRYAPVP